MLDEDLMRAFEAGRPPAEGFHHAQHVRVAWNYLRAYPLHEALGRFCGALGQFAAAQGKPDLYHETISVAYVLLINERLDQTGRQALPDRGRSSLRIMQLPLSTTRSSVATPLTSTIAVISVGKL